MVGYRVHIVKMRQVRSGYVMDGNIVGLIATEGF